MDEQPDQMDRRTILASDRTLLAAERTYAAWVRTALAALAGGIGAKALAKGVLPPWVGKLTGTCSEGCSSNETRRSISPMASS